MNGTPEMEILRAQLLDAFEKLISPIMLDIVGPTLTQDEKMTRLACLEVAIELAKPQLMLTKAMIDRYFIFRTCAMLSINDIRVK